MKFHVLGMEMANVFAALFYIMFEPLPSFVS